MRCKARSGSKRAAKSQVAWLNHAAPRRRETEKPHECGDPKPIVVHVAILEVACHAGGRGFESRRSRFLKHLQMGTFCPVLVTEPMTKILSGVGQSERLATARPPREYPRPHLRAGWHDLP